MTYLTTLVLLKYINICYIFIYVNYVIFESKLNTWCHFFPKSFSRYFLISTHFLSDCSTISKIRNLALIHYYYLFYSTHTQTHTVFLQFFYKFKIIPKLRKEHIYIYTSLKRMSGYLYFLGWLVICVFLSFIFYFKIFPQIAQE